MIINVATRKVPEGKVEIDDNDPMLKKFPKLSNCPICGKHGAFLCDLTIPLGVTASCEDLFCDGVETKYHFGKNALKNAAKEWNRKIKKLEV